MNNPIRFFTATILKWQHLLKPGKYKQVIVDSMKFLVDDSRVWIYGFVVMPNHVHGILIIDKTNDEPFVETRQCLVSTIVTDKFEISETLW